MTTRQGFTPEEWRTLAHTPTETMLAVIVTSLGGNRREFRSLRRTLEREAAEMRTELGTELSGFVAVNADRLIRNAVDDDLHLPVVHARALDHCRESTSILRQKAAPVERTEVGQYVLSCAETTAQTTRAGLFGTGPRVGRAEERFLEQVADALDVSR
jgi:hypothetical protein